MENMKFKVTNTLRTLGVPAHLKGYHYLRSAIMIGLEDHSVIGQVTKILYPVIAEEYKTTASSVERNIRHAIEATWDRGNDDVLLSYFGNTVNAKSGKPTNSEFIALVIDTMELKEESKNNEG